MNISAKKKVFSHYAIGFFFFSKMMPIPQPPHSGYLIYFSHLLKALLKDILKLKGFLCFKKSTFFLFCKLTARTLSYLGSLTLVPPFPHSLKANFCYSLRYQINFHLLKESFLAHHLPFQSKLGSYYILSWCSPLFLDVTIRVSSCVIMCAPHQKVSSME